MIPAKGQVGLVGNLIVQPPAALPVPYGEVLVQVERRVGGVVWVGPRLAREVVVAEEMELVLDDRAAVGPRHRLIRVRLSSAVTIHLANRATHRGPSYGCRAVGRGPVDEVRRVEFIAPEVS